MPNKCSIIICGATLSANRPNLTFHRLPQNKYKKRIWLEVIGKEHLRSDLKHIYICSLHFDENSFNRTLDVLRLKDDAVPSLFKQLDMEHESQESSSSESDPQGWSKSEKLALLNALKVYGSDCTEHIALSLPGKTTDEIIKAITYYKKKSLKHPNYTATRKKERKKVNVVSRVPLGSWAKVLTDTINFKELQTETAAALHILAEFEEFPPVPPGAPEYNLDFKKIYHTIGNALEGKELTKNRVIATILETCLLETALTSKSFIRKSTFRNVINTLRLTEADHTLRLRDPSEPELASVRHLALQRAYNPFNISEDVLKQSVFIQKSIVDDLIIP